MDIDGIGLRAGADGLRAAADELTAAGRTGRGFTIGAGAKLSYTGCPLVRLLLPRESDCTSLLADIESVDVQVVGNELCDVVMC